MLAEYHRLEVVAAEPPDASPRAERIRIEADRMVAYMEKASREAKTHTSWTMPNRAYDDALRGFIEATLGDPEFRQKSVQANATGGLWNQFAVRRHLAVASRQSGRKVEGDPSLCMGGARNCQTSSASCD